MTYSPWLKWSLRLSPILSRAKKETMAWVAVDKNGCEGVFSDRPRRVKDYWATTGQYDFGFNLPSGAIEEFTGMQMDWEMESCEIQEMGIVMREGRFVRITRI